MQIKGDASHWKEQVTDLIRYSADYWKLKVESYRDWFLAQETAKSDERLRPGAPKTTSALFGVEGSFRALQVD